MQKSHLLKSIFILFISVLCCLSGFILAGFFASKYVKANQTAKYFKASDEWFEFGKPMQEINGKCLTSNQTMNIFEEKETPKYLSDNY